MLTFSFQLLTFNSFAQNVGISSTGVTPNEKALLDLDAAPSNDKGLLVPRLTTTERDAIAAPIPESLLIYNTTTQCYEGWNSATWVAFGCIGCRPTGVTASAAPNPICEGGTLSLTGGATDATSWSWTGPNGFTSSSQNPTIVGITTAGAGVYTLTASNACGGSAPPVNTASVVVSAAPSTADAGSDINPACDATTATLAGNTPTTGTGEWSVVSGTATITTPSSPTSGVTGLASTGTATLRWTISNSPCTASTDDVVITTTACSFTCGDPLVISHTAGTVAPVTKSVNYGTVTSSLSGASKCWITQNLGSTNQASSATDATEASAGWYWQFNRKQGFKHDGTTRTPSTAWIYPISEDSDWGAAQDPCTIELGTGWRIPTKTEWENALANGSWANYNDTYNSVLKLHAAGYLKNTDASLNGRGSYGAYWSIIQDNTDYGADLWLQSNYCGVSSGNKASGYTLRCLKD